MSDMSNCPNNRPAGKPAGMRVKFDGHVRLRHKVGWGPFMKEKWEPIAFTWEGSTLSLPNEYERVTRELGIALAASDDRLILRARLKSQHLILGDCLFGHERNFPVSVLSVSGVELTGQVQFLPDPSRLG